MTILGYAIRAASYLVGALIVCAAVAIVIFSLTGYLW